MDDGCVGVGGVSVMAVAVGDGVDSGSVADPDGGDVADGDVVDGKGGCVVDVVGGVVVEVGDVVDKRVAVDE